MNRKWHLTGAMIKFLRLIHWLGIALFVGAVANLVLVQPSAATSESLTPLLGAKLSTIGRQAIPGLLLLGLSGLWLMLQERRNPVRHRWLGLKLILVLLIVANGTFVLTPAMQQLVSLTAGWKPGSALSPRYAAVSTAAALAGFAQVALVIAVMGLSAYRPRLRRIGQWPSQSPVHRDRPASVAPGHGT